MLKQLEELPPSTQRRIRLVAALLVAVALLVVAWQLLLVLVPLAVSAVIASLLIPVMRLGERTPLARRWPTIQPGDGGGNRHAAGRRHSPDRHRHRSLCAGGRRDYHCGGGACDHRGSRQRLCPDSGGIPGASAGDGTEAGGPAPGIVTRFHLRFRGLGGGECSQPHPEQHRAVCHPSGDAHCRIPVSLPVRALFPTPPGG